MRDLYIRSVTGDERMLSDYVVTRKTVVNGDKTITATCIKTDKNKKGYALILNENFFVYEGEEYVIKKVKEKVTGQTSYAEATCIHRFFDDMGNGRVYETISGTFDINRLLNFTFAGSGYSFIVSDSTLLSKRVQVDNFGDSDRLSLYKSILDKFVCEFEVIGRTAYLATEISRYTNEQMRYNFNVQEPSKEIDTSSFSTYIKGFGKKNENGSYTAQAEYTSPLASVYGIKHAAPVRDDRFTDKASLLAEIKRQLNDTLVISLSTEVKQLNEKYGIKDIRAGDYLYCIIDPFEIDTRIRVVEYEDYSDPLKSPKCTLGTLRKKASATLASISSKSKSINSVIDSTNGKVKTSSLQPDIVNAARAMENFTKDGGFDLTKAVGVLPEDHVSVGPNTIFSPGYDPSKINIYELATETANGLMAAADKKKLNQIITQAGQTYNLPILLQTIADLQRRITALEGGNS